MSLSDYSLLQQSTSKEEILDINRILREQDVHTKLINSSFATNDVTRALGASTIEMFAIHVKKEDYKKANHILEREAEKQVDKISKDHYIFEFTDDELYDVIYNKEKWSKIDYVLAKKRLIERGREIDEKKIKTVNEEKDAEINKHPMPKYIILFGYTAAIGIPLINLFTFPYIKKNGTGNTFWNILMIWWLIIGTPISGMWIAHFITRKKTLSNGEEEYIHNQKDVKNGKTINILAWMFFIFYILLSLYIKEFIIS